MSLALDRAVLADNDVVIVGDGPEVYGWNTLRLLS